MIGLISSSEPGLWLLWVLPDVLAADTLFSKERRENRPSATHFSVRRAFPISTGQTSFLSHFCGVSATQRGKRRTAGHVPVLSGHAVALRTMAPSIFAAGSPAQTPRHFCAGFCPPSEAAPHALQ